MVLETNRAPLGAALTLAWIRHNGPGARLVAGGTASATLAFVRVVPTVAAVLLASALAPSPSLTQVLNLVAEATAVGTGMAARTVRCAVL
jgi:hypothetical protein